MLVQSYFITVSTPSAARSLLTPASCRWPCKSSKNVNHSLRVLVGSCRRRRSAALFRVSFAIACWSMSVGKEMCLQQFSTRQLPRREDDKHSFGAPCSDQLRRQRTDVVQFSLWGQCKHPRVISQQNNCAPPPSPFPCRRFHDGTFCALRLN
jgi:hypothetical protein